jgi:hypothetical protein
MNNNNLYAQEQDVKMRQQAATRAAERQQLVRQARETYPSGGEHVLGCLGRALIVCGRWLERSERRKRVAYLASEAR